MSFVLKMFINRAMCIKWVSRIGIVCASLDIRVFMRAYITRERHTLLVYIKNDTDITSKSKQYEGIKKPKKKHK